MEYLPSVWQVVPGEDYTVYIYFSDGSIRLADIKPLLSKGGVFDLLAAREFFRNRLTVMNGTVAWDVTGTRDTSRCIDLDPLVLYRSSPKVPDPLREDGPGKK